MRLRPSVALRKLSSYGGQAAREHVRKSPFTLFWTNSRRITSSYVHRAGTTNEHTAIVNISGTNPDYKTIFIFLLS